MTEYFVPKFVPAAAAALALLGLSGCDRAGGVLSQTLAQIKTVPVDANDRSAGTAADRKINAKDVALLVDTAKALTVGKDGVLSRTARTQAAPGQASDSLFSTAPASADAASSADGNSGEKTLQIAVVDPLRMDRPDDGPPLDVGLHGVEMDPQAALAAARRALPDIPVAVQAAVAQFSVPKQVSQSAPKPTPAADDDRPKSEIVKSDLHRSIQIGSFGTMAAAQNALEQLRDSHPVVEHYHASFQKVMTGAGRALVRVKLGPVDSDAQAQSLCGQLDIRDIWCHKAG